MARTPLAYLVAIAFAGTATPVFAQQAPVTLTMTTDEASQLLNALGEKPWKNVNPLMQKLIVQLNFQLKPPLAAKPDEKPKAEEKPKSDAAPEAKKPEAAAGKDHAEEKKP